MRLVDGAMAIQGDLPASATVEVEVPVEAGDALDTGIHRFSTLAMVRERQAMALRGVDDWALTIGGDCGVSLAAVEHAAIKNPDALAVVWFDAHPDLHTPESSPSGGFCGMVLRAIAGEGLPELSLSGPNGVPLERVVLVGARDGDPAETSLITERAIRSLTVDAVDSPKDLLAAVKATGASAIFLHINLDVLDPAAMTGLTDLVPFGLGVEKLTGLITALKAEFALAGATISGFAPASVDAATEDLPSILRIIGALTRA